MEIFDYTFRVDAPLKSVAEFHVDTRILKKLTPALIFVKLHRVDPMAEGSISEFTLWIGLLPIHWRAVHSNVSFRGFTDTQEKGPLASWKHTHRFEPIDENTTQIHEQIIYEYPSGMRGLLTRILFGHLGLTALFTYRKWATRRGLSRSE